MRRRAVDQFHSLGIRLFPVCQSYWLCTTSPEPVQHSVYEQVVTSDRLRTVEGLQWAELIAQHSELLKQLAERTICPLGL